MRTIVAGRSRQYVTRVSDADYDHLMQWLWTFAVSHPKGSLVYIRRSIRVGDGNVTVLMHHVVMAHMGDPRPSPRHTTHHRDGDSLNNTRRNLCWRTPGQQMAENRTRYAIAAELAAVSPMAASLAEIPFHL